jgi:RNA-binding signal recognition particle 68
MSCERAWAYAMQLKFEMNTEPRKKYHMHNRLKKATQFATKLVSIHI